MKFALETREGLDGLVVHVKQSRNHNHLLMALAASVAAFYFFWRIPQTRIEQVFIASLIVAISLRDVFSKWRGVDVELCINNLELISKGHSPSGYRPSTISRADIYSLEYRRAQQGGGEFPDLPEGLYVEHLQRMPWDASTCVLPHVGRQLTNEIIQKIMDRFPDTGTLVKRHSQPYPLISLSLDLPVDR